MKDPIVVAMLAAIAAVAVLLGTMYAATLWAGKGSASGGKEGSQPSQPVPAWVPQTFDAAAPRTFTIQAPQVDARQQRDFDHLLGLSNQYQDDPTAGCAAWADFIEKYPHTTREIQTVAEQRLELYQRLKARTSLEDRARPGEPEF